MMQQARYFSSRAFSSFWNFEPSRAELWQKKIRVGRAFGREKIELFEFWMPLQKSIGTKNFTRSNRQISSLEYVNIMMKYNQYISDICSQIWEKLAYVHHKIFLSLKNFELLAMKNRAEPSLKNHSSWRAIRNYEPSRASYNLWRAELTSVRCITNSDKLSPKLSDLSGLEH